MNRALEEYAHASHGFQIANDGVSRGVAHSVRFRGQSIHHADEFFSEIRIVNREQQMFVSALPAANCECARPS